MLHELKLEEAKKLWINTDNVETVSPIVDNAKGDKDWSFKVGMTSGINMRVKRSTAQEARYAMSELFKKMT